MATDARIEELLHEIYTLEAMIERGVEAFRLTREYVGEELLPSEPGWSWYDWCREAEALLDGRPNPVP